MKNLTSNTENQINAANLTVHAAKAGTYILVRLTEPMAEQMGKTPAEMGMKSTDCGAVAPVKLAVAPADTLGSGWYYGSKLHVTTDVYHI